MERPPFWIVWSPSGDRPPQHRHTGRVDAEQEAERLASAHPGRQFYVLQPTFQVVAQHALRTRYDLDEVPF